MEAVNTHIMQNNKINIHFQFTICSVRHFVNMHTPVVLQGTFQVNFSSELFKRFIYFIKRFTQEGVM